MSDLNTRLDKTTRDLFRAVVPIRSHAFGITPEMPVPLGLATGDAGQILKMGGVCTRWAGRNYGLQIFFFP
jgi:hypothetical protein